MWNLEGLPRQHVRRHLTHRSFAESPEIDVVVWLSFEPTWLSLAMAMVSTPPPLRLVMKSYDKLSQKLMQSWSVDQVHSVINCCQTRPHTYRNSTCNRYTRYSNRHSMCLCKASFRMMTHAFYCSFILTRAWQSTLDCSGKILLHFPKDIHESYMAGWGGQGQKNHVKTRLLSSSCEPSKFLISVHHHARSKVGIPGKMPCVVAVALRKYCLLRPQTLRCLCCSPDFDNPELMRLHEITLLLFLSLFRCFRCDFVCSQEAERCESWQRFDFANLQKSFCGCDWLIDWYLKYRWKRMATKGNEQTPCKQVQGVDRKNRCAWTRAGEEVWRSGNVSIQWSQWSYNSATKIFQRPGHTVASSRTGSLFWIA